MSSSEDRSELIAALKREAAASNLFAANNWIADASTSMFFYSFHTVDKKYGPDGSLSVFQYLLAKPISVDSLLWSTLFPSSPMGGARKRIGLRVMGAFSLDGIQVSSRSSQRAPGEDPNTWAETFVQQFRSEAEGFRSGVSNTAGFLQLIDQSRRERPDLPWRHSLLQLFTLVCNGDLDAAGALAHEGVRANEGDFAVGNTSVWQMLADAYDSGTGIFALDYQLQIP